MNKGLYRRLSSVERALGDRDVLDNVVAVFTAPLTAEPNERWIRGLCKRLGVCAPHLCVWLVQGDESVLLPPVRLGDMTAAQERALLDQTGRYPHILAIITPEAVLFVSNGDETEERRNTLDLERQVAEGADG